MEIRTMQDGGARCAHFADFINLQESPAGFGDTDEEAIAALLKEAPARCRRAMWWGTGMPAGTCDEPAYGPEKLPHRADPGSLVLAPEVFRCSAHDGPTPEEAAKAIWRFLAQCRQQEPKP